MSMKLYRSKHAVEAMQWTGENRDALRAFSVNKGNTPVFHAHGYATARGNDVGYFPLRPTQWLVWSRNEFTVLTDDEFRAEYDEVTNDDFETVLTKAVEDALDPNTPRTLIKSKEQLAEWFAKLLDKTLEAEAT